MFKNFINWNKTIGQTFMSLSEIVINIDKRLKEIEAVMPNGKTVSTISGDQIIKYSNVWSVDYVDNCKKEIMNQFDKDYFTKEYINRDAKNTNKLYVVSWDKISIAYYKEWNMKQTTKILHVFVHDGVEYLFV